MCSSIPLRLAIVGLANETNRLVTALDVPVDEQFL
jgi:hypothetical protein